MALDYEAMAKANDEVREVLRAMVAGLVNDGFTDREARVIVTGIMGNMGKPEADGTEEA